MSVGGGIDCQIQIDVCWETTSCVGGGGTVGGGRVDCRVCVVVVVGGKGLSPAVVRMFSVYRSLLEALWSFSICLPLSLTADNASSKPRHRINLHVSNE